MNDLDFILPCGFTKKYSSFLFNENTYNVFLCPFCGSHFISSLECLEIDRNKLALKEKKLELKKQQFNDELKNVQKFKENRKFLVEENIQNLKNRVDLRREEIKLYIDKKIDDYYEELLKQIENEKDSYLTMINEDFEKISLFEKETINFEVMENFFTNSKIELNDIYEKKISNGINLIGSTLKKLNQTNLCLENGDQNLDVKKLFGKLSVQEYQYIDCENTDMDDRFQKEICLKFVVENFSKLEIIKKIELKTKPFTIPNLEWSIFLEMNQDVLLIGIYLKSNSVIHLQDTGLNIQAEFRLFHITDPSKDYVFRCDRKISKKNISSTCLKFVRMENITNMANGFYKIFDDSISFESKINFYFSSFDSSIDDSFNSS